MSAASRPAFRTRCRAKSLEPPAQAAEPAFEGGRMGARNLLDEACRGMRS